MKSRFGNYLAVTFLILILVMIIPKQDEGQTSMGVLPVTSSTVSSSVLNARDWQEISFRIQDLLIMHLAGIGSVSKLSRQHILLLLKEIPDPDPENLDAGAYSIISKKENLHYLLKCSLESIRQADRNVLAYIRIIIVDGYNGKVFWEKVYKTSKSLSNPAVTVQTLMDEVFKPFISEISNEVKSLKY
jgi:hypothetical protein